MINKLLLLIFCLATNMVIAQVTDSLPQEQNTPLLLPEESEEEPCTTDIPESFPYPCECSEVWGGDRDRCRSDMMVHEVFSNLTNYPDSSRLMGNEGMVLVSFVINEEGKLGDIAVIRSVDKWIDAESIKVVGAMVEQHCWRPGRACDKPIAVRLNMPVRWKLE